MVFKLKWQYESHHAVWVPCAGYSHLVGQVAAECCQAAVAIFDFLETIDMFFTVSTHHYKLLTCSLNHVLHLCQWGYLQPHGPVDPIQ